MPGTDSFVALGRRGVWRVASLSAGLLCGGPLLAQQETAATPYVMHVYTNLMQVPALVLDTSDRPLKRIETSNFAISLDRGTRFRPSFVRPQGDDAISLSILLDLSGDTGSLLLGMREGVPTLAPANLHPKDHVSLFALDCKLIRCANDLPASPAMLDSALQQALAFPDLHGPKKRTAGCGSTVSLVNALGVIARDLATLPGRRVLLVLSDGYDGKSTLRWSQLRQYAAQEGIAIFAMSYRLNPGSLNLGPIDTGHHEAEDIDKAQDPLAMLCDLTGGVALNVDSNRGLARALPRFVEMLRGRYILEFHRPADAKAGVHTVEVTLDHTTAHIRVGGTMVRSATAAELARPEIESGEGSNAQPVTSTRPAAPQQR